MGLFKRMPVEKSREYSFGTPRQLAAELLGTLFLLAAVVGSGIMAERLAQGNMALALLANSVATGAALVALILAFAPVSGAHFNPAVTVVQTALGFLSIRRAVGYVVAQLVGAFLGVFVAHLMFELPLVSASQHQRHGAGQLAGEFVATLGLLLVIAGCQRAGAQTAAFAVGAFITAGYWFTSSTSFANPAVTLARSATDTFAGIRLVDVPGFLLAQFLAAGVGIVLLGWLRKGERAELPERAGVRT
jgi:glycerol uptake facilitator-like aquaporin